MILGHRDAQSRLYKGRPYGGCSITHDGIKKVPLIMYTPKISCPEILLHTLSTDMVVIPVRISSLSTVPPFPD